MNARKILSALLGSALTLGLLAGCGGGGSASPSVYYLNDENELKFLKNLTAESEAIELTDRLVDPDRFREDSGTYRYYLNSGYTADPDIENGLLWYSKDGKTAYFLARLNGQTGTLYKADLANLQPGSDKNDNYIEKVDSSVVSGWVEQLPDGTLLYKKSGDSADRLYWYNGTESVKMAEGNWSNLTVTNDGKGILYRQYDSGEYSLYYRPLTADGEREKLASKVDLFYYTNGTILFFKVDDRDTSGADSAPSGSLAPYYGNKNYTPYDVYTVVPGQEAVKLADNVGCPMGSVWGNTFYYTVPKKQEIPADTLVVGDLADVDENPPLPPPDDDFMVDIFASSISELEDVLLSNGHDRDTYDRWWNLNWGGTDGTENFIANKYAGKYSAENEMRYKNYVNDWGEGDGYLLDWEAYQEYWNSLNESYEQRKRLAELAGRTLTFYHDALCFFNGTESVTICDGVYIASFTDAKTQTALYRKLRSNEEIGKVDMESLTNVNSLGYWFLDAQEPSSESELYHYTIGSAAEGQVDLEGMGDYWYPVTLLSGGKDLIFHDEDSGELFVASIANGVLAKPASIAEDVYTFYYPDDCSAFYYYENVSGGTGDLKVYKNGASTVLAKDVSYGGQGNTVFEDGSLLVLKDLGSSGGTLTQIKNGESSRVADDVTYYLRLSDNSILYCSDGNLYRYDGKEKTRLSSDVRYVWSPSVISGFVL